ncbi:SOS response-associated peptidase [Aeromicrobium sp. REDSEA-S32_B7]|uniref:SOS response-associated peptidase n=1 Tax=Aeromicrobium sp. REDSEA-S32_B7 TaxID=1811526 RepID=UPI000AF1CD4A|nr:SOS response-associated peptidase [Aeromicrobium sp. REDSEA-S32_B7]
MCGRYATTRTSAELDDAFAAGLGDGVELPAPDWNVAPTKQAPLVVGRRRDDADEAAPPRRELHAATWGLVPSWAKDRSIGNRMINARSETVAEKPAFRSAFARRRAIVPADGYYEWYAGEGPKAPKQPFYITAAGDGDARDVLALAGLYEFWRPGRRAPRPAGPGHAGPARGVARQHPGEQRAPQRSGARGAAAGRVRRGCCVGPRNRARVGTVVMRVRRPTCSRALSAPPPAPRPCPSTSSPQATVGPRE